MAHRTQDSSPRYLFVLKVVSLEQQMEEGQRARRGEGVRRSHAPLQGTALPGPLAVCSAPTPELSRPCILQVYLKKKIQLLNLHMFQITPSTPPGPDPQSLGPQVSPGSSQSLEVAGSSGRAPMPAPGLEVLLYTGPRQ